MPLSPDAPDAPPTPESSDMYDEVHVQAHEITYDGVVYFLESSTGKVCLAVRSARAAREATPPPSRSRKQPAPRAARGGVAASGGHA